MTAAELAEQYAQLKQRITDVDRKYSMSYVEPQLDMPESLNLEPMEYHAPTEAELQSRAEIATEAWFNSSKHTIDKTLSVRLASVSNQRKRALNTLEAAKRKYAKQKTQGLGKLAEKTIDNGVYYSSAMTDNEITDDYNAEIAEAEAVKAATYALCDSEQAAANAQYQQSYTALVARRQAKQAEYIEKLREAETKKQESVFKYNNSIEERELRYQGNRSRIYEQARQQEYSRALAASSLYAQLGSSGVEEQKLYDKLTVSKSFLAGFKRSDAQSLIYSDTFMSANLGSYFSSLEEWVSSLPDW